MKEEIWKAIPEYEGFYEVSNLGKVRSWCKILRNGILTKRNKPYYPKLHSGHSGHLSVWLYKNGVGKKWQVHRLVAIAFIPNPQNLPFINHKDEIPYHNIVENLE